LQQRSDQLVKFAAPHDPLTAHSSRYCYHTAYLHPSRYAWRSLTSSSESMQSGHD
jgi:hypothetical protein